MKTSLKRTLATLLVASGFVVAVPFGALGKDQQAKDEKVISPASLRGEDRIQREVQHELRMLPYYTVFDNLQFKVDGDTVILSGQVVRPTLRSDAVAAVERVEGVTHVVDNIEVLPLSDFDNRIRLAVYRSIYGTAGLDRYAFQANPSIHIIVKNGNVKLEGVVANKMDKNIAGIRANSVSGVFSVTNDLRLDS
jgi:hyperosmotically inducible protein